MKLKKILQLRRKKDNKVMPAKAKKTTTKTPAVQTSDEPKSPIVRNEKGKWVPRTSAKTKSSK